MPLINRIGWLFYYFKNRVIPFSWLAKLLNGKFHYYRSFMRENVIETSIHFSSNIKKIENYGIWIVGSDQVWRSDFIKRNPTFYFLPFLPDNIRRKCISYAASFGSASWNLDTQTTSQIKNLINGFEAVSVREKDGVLLCNNLFDIQSTLVPDPTILLYPHDYDNMIHRTIEQFPKDYEGKFIAYYILDMTPEKKKYLEMVQRRFGLKLINMMHNTILDSKCILRRPIEQWLDIVKNAQLIVTDSFHGCVFSIIYNTKFIVLNNSQRGSSRFETLLSTLNLNELMIDEASLNFIPSSQINWKKVNETIDIMRKKGRNFIIEHVG